MDQILKNTYTNIPTCISDALKELYITQKKLQEETKGIISQTKNLLSSYEKDVNSLRNEVNLGSMNFKLYCQNTTEKIESIKNHVENQVHINNIKNDDWRNNIEKKIFQDTIGWQDGANHLNNAIKKSEDLEKEFHDFKERINIQKIDKDGLNKCLLNTMKNDKELIKDINKLLNLEIIKNENEQFKKEFDRMRQLENQEKLNRIELEQNLQNNMDKYIKQINDCQEYMNNYKKENDNYVSNLYKMIFDVNKSQREIKNDIKSERNSRNNSQLNSIDHKEVGLNPNPTLKKVSNNKKQQLQESNQSSQKSLYQNDIEINEERIQELENRIEQIEISKTNDKQIINDIIIKQQSELIQNVNNYTKNIIENQFQNIFEQYIQPIIIQVDSLQAVQNQQEQLQQQQFQVNNNKNNKLQSKKSTIKSSEEEQEDNEIKEISEINEYKNNNSTIKSIHELDKIESQKNNVNSNKQINKNNNNNDNLENSPTIKETKLQSTQKQRNSQLTTEQQQKDIDINNYIDPYKRQDISPQESPLKSKYPNSINNIIQQKNNRTAITSFKKRTSTSTTENYQNLILNSQESQQLQNLSFYTEEEEDLLNQICSSKNKNHINMYKQRKSLQSSQMISKNTPKISNQSYMSGNNDGFNHTMPDLSFEHQQQQYSPLKKWPPLENKGIHQKIINVNPKQLNGQNYTVMSHTKQNKMTVLNLSLDFNNPSNINSLNNIQQNNNNNNNNSSVINNNLSFSQNLQNQQPIIQLCSYGNKSMPQRPSKYSMANNNSNGNGNININNNSNSGNNNKIKNELRPISQQQSHRNSTGGIFGTKQSIKIIARPKTSHENNDNSFHFKK